VGHRRRLTARSLRDALGGLARTVAPAGATLEVSLPAQETGRTLQAALLVDGEMRARAVSAIDEAVPVFGAFLDGVQDSRVVAYVGSVPIVQGRMGAVIRARADRRLATWGDGPHLDEALYLPLALVPREVADALETTERPIVDTTDASPGDGTAPEDCHPQQWLRRALHLVQRGREALERALAEAWCRQGGAVPLYVDGGLPSSGVVLGSTCAVGVIKSHHTLYATGSALATVATLGIGERSSPFVVETRWREPVASWYLRLRRPEGHDPFWGLVRIEVPLALLLGDGTSPDASADRVSRWVAAEASPLALPDARWDTMAYGIRDCEVFLRATLGRAMA